VGSQSIEKSGPLVLRCDAGEAVGIGHVMRCLALAQAWKQTQGDAVFVMVRPNALIGERIKDEGFEIVHLDADPGTVRDSERVGQIARAHGSNWLVVDGYIFDVNYQRALKAAELNVLLVDDEGKAGYYCADLVLNQNAYACERLYSHRETYTRLLLGLRFAMLRSEFRCRTNDRRVISPEGRRVLITMGGSDPANVTLQVIQALALLSEDVEVKVVIGECNPHGESLQSAVMNHRGRMSLMKNGNMPELMAWADIAVSSSGTTTAELCALGLPSIVIDTAPNQTPVAKELDRIGAALYLSLEDLQRGERVAHTIRDLLASFERRSTISETARSLVDGIGAQRVVSAIRGFDIRLRPAEEQDCKLIWDWANDPEVRAASFQPEFIPWEKHVEWYQAYLHDWPGSRMMIAIDSDQKEIGVVRFRLENERAIVSISLDAAVRGKGYAADILMKAVGHLFSSSSVFAVDAYVKLQNEVSKKLFESAGFRRSPTLATIHGDMAIHYVMSRNSC
jgi:UDP-2,4-diacetamido-2,4,6-trideoxy-beta-L-altropyranose hydrolase